MQQYLYLLVEWKDLHVNNINTTWQGLHPNTNKTLCSAGLFASIGRENSWQLEGQIAFHQTKKTPWVTVLWER